MISLLLALFLSTPSQGDVAELIAAFEASRSDQAGRSSALAALVSTADAKAFAPVLAEYARASGAYRGAAADERKTAQLLERGRTVYADIERRAKRNQELEDLLEERAEELEELEAEVRIAGERAANEGEWSADLRAGAEELLARVPSSKRRGLERRLLEDVEEHPEPGVQIAAAELLGVGGSSGTATALHKELVSIVAASSKIAKRLPKLEVDVRKMEKRMQKEAEQLDGRMARGTAEQYRAVKAEASSLRRTLTANAVLREVIVAAAAQALAREPEEEQAKSLQVLARSLKKAKGGISFDTIALMGKVPTEAARESLFGLLEDEDDPAGIGALLTALATRGAEELVPELKETYLEHESWHVQSVAVAALASVRSIEGIPVLIELLGTAEGRLRTDIRTALGSLTGMDFRTNQTLWRRWWDESSEGFVVPASAALAEQEEDPATFEGVTFFGISTDSQRVLFVLDLSKSMNFSMVARDNPRDNPGQPFDMPREGEISRLTAARRDLIKALGGLREGALFNLVFYASDVWTWQDELVTLDEESRAAVLETIDGLEAVGATNIFAALQTAFDLAGVEAGDEWSAPTIDTIYFLSDGRPSVGLATDPDEILSFVREMNKNAGIVIHAIGLSGAQDPYLLSQLAEQNGGDYAAR